MGILKTYVSCSCILTNIACESFITLKGGKDIQQVSTVICLSGIRFTLSNTCILEGSEQRSPPIHVTLSEGNKCR